MSRQAYKQLVAGSKRIAVLSSVAGLVSWDQETMMPKGGTASRGEQSAALSGIIHEQATSDERGELISACEADGFADQDSIEAANIRQWRRDYDRARKLPRAHVEEVAKTQSISQPIWAKARADSNFADFAPSLKHILELTRKTAEYYGWPEDGEPYDALLEGYEPGMTAAEVETIFVPLRDRLASLIAEVADAPKKPDDSIHRRIVPRQQQEKFVRFVAEAIGFDFTNGRLDVSTHPFCSGIAPGDCRLTTRFHENNVADALSSTMHEAGHGMYEQNLDADAFGTPCGEAVSLGIHESQSRGWENIVGRGRAFWEWCLPHAQKFMPDAFGDQTVDSVYAAQNIVKPSYIRVEADETTYNLHIMLRFELERAMIRGEIEVDDIPAAWNEKFRKYLGIDVDKDSNGCLQDVHWAFGLMGYFPTYALGNLYACQIFATAHEALGDLDDLYRRGEFQPLLEWLTTNIHQHGRRYRAAELCRRITGKDLSADPLMCHLEAKIRPIYGI